MIHLQHPVVDYQCEVDKGKLTTVVAIFEKLTLQA